MGLWTCDRAGHDTTGVIAHSDKGVQYLAVRYTQRLAQAGAVASVGPPETRMTNALAEAFNSLFKAELVRNKGSWRNIDDLEIAVAKYIDWFNHRRLHGTTPRRLPSTHQFRASTEPGTGHFAVDWPRARAAARMSQDVRAPSTAAISAASAFTTGRSPDTTPMRKTPGGIPMPTTSPSLVIDLPVRVAS